MWRWFYNVSRGFLSSLTQDNSFEVFICLNTLLWRPLKAGRIAQLVTQSSGLTKKTSSLIVILFPRYFHFCIPYFDPSRYLMVYLDRRLLLLSRNIPSVLSLPVVFLEPNEGSGSHSSIPCYQLNFSLSYYNFHVH